MGGDLVVLTVLVRLGVMTGGLLSTTKMTLTVTTGKWIKASVGFRVADETREPAKHLERVFLGRKGWNKIRRPRRDSLGRWVLDEQEPEQDFVRVFPCFPGAGATSGSRHCRGGLAHRRRMPETRERDGGGGVPRPVSIPARCGGKSPCSSTRERQMKSLLRC